MVSAGTPLSPANRQASCRLICNLIAEHTSRFIQRLRCPVDLRHQTLLKTLDRINARMGRGNLRTAGEGFAKPWPMRSTNKSRAYTADCNGLAVVR